MTEFDFSNIFSLNLINFETYHKVGNNFAFFFGVPDNLNGFIDIKKNLFKTFEKMKSVLSALQIKSGSPCHAFASEINPFIEKFLNAENSRIALDKHIEVAEETKERWEKKGIATHRFVKTIGNALQKIDEKSKKSRKRDSAQVLNMMQNTAELLSKSINTADTTECGQAGIPRPLLQAIQEKKDAGADVATITYITQAIRGAAIIADTWKPIADGKEKATYCDTLLNITKIITGQDNPVKSQIEEKQDAIREKKEQ